MLTTKNNINALILEAKKENPDITTILEIAERAKESLEYAERHIEGKLRDLKEQKRVFKEECDERMDNIRQAEIGVDEKLKELENAMFYRRKEYEMKERFRRNFEKLKSMVDGMNKEIN